jgi:hypothetical protein
MTLLFVKGVTEIILSYINQMVLPLKGSEYPAYQDYAAKSKKYFCKQLELT